MPLDGICIHALTTELTECMLGASIQKIYQPERDELVLLLHSPSGNFRLLLSANPSSPRLHITEESYENPMTPPVFCMLLRKHLTGGKVVSVCQPGFERIVDIVIESYTELGDLTQKHLICEMMGRHSNLILTDENHRIIDCIKHIDLTVSSVRMVLPGLFYETAPSQNKKNPLTTTEAELTEQLSAITEGVLLDKALVDIYTGISPLAGREIAFLAGLEDRFAAELTPDERKRLAKICCGLFEKISAEQFSPCLLYVAGSEKPRDFWAFAPRQYGNAVTLEENRSMSRIIEQFYSRRAAAERMKQKSQALVKTVTNLLERCRKKQIIYQATLKDSKNKEQYKIYGDLITGNLYRIEQGASVAVVENYYEEDLPTVRIALDPQLSPTKNAQRYYKKYTKAKHAEEMAQKQMESNTEELLYLESVLFMLEEATSAADLAQIRQELEDGGYIASGQKKGKKAPKQQKGLPPMELEFEGYTIYIGRNNVQNDYLTLKLARANDLWLHVKHFPGSHVIVKSKGEDFPERVIEYAAKQAALHSKTEARSKTEIDYTLVKNVKKPNGAKPGMVIYEHYKTAVIDPAE